VVNTNVLLNKTKDPIFTPKSIIPYRYTGEIIKKKTTFLLKKDKLFSSFIFFFEEVSFLTQKAHVSSNVGTTRGKVFFKSGIISYNQQLGVICIENY